MDDRIGTSKPEFETVLHADVQNVEELDFDATDVMALLQKRNYKAHMCVKNTSNILQSSVSVFKQALG